MKEREDEPEIHLGTREAANSRPISAAGLKELERRRDAAVDPEERALLEARIGSALVVGPPKDRTVVAFGATVTVTGASKKVQRFTLVGEDEVDIPRGQIGLASPLARALVGARLGDVVIWPRPAGNKTLTVAAIDYA